MKLSRILLLFQMTFFLSCLAWHDLKADINLSPYYSLQFSEGTTIPSKGDWMFSTNLTSDLGLIYQPVREHRFIGFYEMKYTGPGLRREEGEKFTDRLMDHVFIFRHYYSFKNDYVLKTQLDFMRENKRTGSNEVWGQGLYDFNRVGLGLTLERKYENDLLINFTQQYHSMDFPNYTDLLSEFQAGGESVESSTGKQNHGLYQTGIKVTRGPSSFLFDIILMAYGKQKVVVETVQPDQTYYSSNRQRDISLSIGLRHDQKVFEKMVLSPSITCKIKSSNQNYQHFAISNSTVPVKFISGYYDYNEIDLQISSAYMISDRWEIFFSPEWIRKRYLSRPPRDEDNNFLTSSQVNNLIIISTGFTLKPNDITRTTFFYTYQGQTSNMKFEKYIPYNYSGHFFGVNLSYTY